MRILAAATRGVRHVTGAIAEGAIIVAIAAALAFGVGVVSGQPANVNPVDAAQKVKATLIATPTPLAIGQVLHLSGAGLNPRDPAWVKTETDTATGWRNLAVASDGTYALDLSFSRAGTVQVGVYQVVHNRSILMSSGTVTVLGLERTP